MAIKHQVATKYTQNFSTHGLPKYAEIVIFGTKMCHLATLADRTECDPNFIFLGKEQNDSDHKCQRNGNGVGPNKGQKILHLFLSRAQKKDLPVKMKSKKF
jgi:hypothetical protein